MTDKKRTSNKKIWNNVLRAYTWTEKSSMEKKAERNHQLLKDFLKRSEKASEAIEGADCLFESKWLKKVTDQD